jgi:hypothetical protein
MKRALLVGINDYPGTQNDLQGCVNDITNLYDVLVKYFDFATTDIRMLSDKRAVKRAILDGLKVLLAGAAAGDTLVFHYSGHGSQVRDTEGDELADGLDEIICPWDFNWEGSFIKDDDFAAAFSGLKKGVSLEVILDSCHSGTGTREMILDRKSFACGQPMPLDEKSLWSSSHCIRPRYLSPPADISLRADEIYGSPLKVRKLGEGEALNHILWAACRSNQYSADADVGGKPGGAFTYFFCKHIRDNAGKVARTELLKLVRASLKHEGFSQVPQLEGPEENKKLTVFS